MAKIFTVAIDIGVIASWFTALGSVEDSSLGVLLATFATCFYGGIVKLKISDSGENGLQTEGIILVDPIYDL